MKTASLKDIQTELENIPPKEMMTLCLRLAKFKKENKELLTYLLFESFDEQAYIDNIKKDITEQFMDMNTGNAYFIKKSLRRILRMITKYTRYTATDTAEVQLLLHFCTLIKESGIPVRDNQVLMNIFENQLKKIGKAVAKMHEDLQYDYLKELGPLTAS